MASGTCEYYWKIYDGTTPEDAVEGGQDVNGATFYIGLCHLKLVNEILAGMIIPSMQAAHVTSFAVSLYIKNDIFNEVKILCSPNKNAFEWIPTTSENLHLLSNHNLVPGGVVLGQNLYIGRIRRRKGGFILGKVFPDNFVFRGLYIPAGCTHFQYLTYCVLAFNSTKIKKTEEIAIQETRDEFSGNDGFSIDVRQKGQRPELDLFEVPKEVNISLCSNNNSTPVVSASSEGDFCGNAASKETRGDEKVDGNLENILRRCNNNSKPMVFCDSSEEDLSGNAASNETRCDEKFDGNLENILRRCNNNSKPMVLCDSSEEDLSDNAASKEI